MTPQAQQVAVTAADEAAADKAFDIAFRGDTDGIDDAMAQLFANHRASPVAAPIFTPERIAAAHAETARLQSDLDITNADHIALWLEANMSDSPLGWLACRIVEAHEAVLQNPPKHNFWSSGEPGCPSEIKAGNGELHTLRCKHCGQDNPRNDRCHGGVAS
jgi:hypothetical protein